MPMTFAVSEDGKYIIQTVTGDITRELAAGYNRETHALGLKLGMHRYLLDLTDSRNTDAFYENYDFAYTDMKAEIFDRHTRVAMLVHPDDHTHDFIETVSRNAGLDVTLFTDRGEAVRHLREE